MFGFSHTIQTGIYMNTSAPPLAIFLNTLKSTTIPITPPWPTASAAIDLAERFDCEDTARTILYAACRMGAKTICRFDALVVACCQDHLLAACRLLLTGHQSEVWGISLRPGSGEWATGDRDRLSISWLRALTRAEK